jgi:hypothetical protein
MQAHGGRLEGVVNLKVVPESVWGTLTLDLAIISVSNQDVLTSVTLLSDHSFVNS